jgi:hypothetical protein
MPRPFLGNGSVHMFLLLAIRFLMQQLNYNNGRVVFNVVRAERL